MKKRIYKMLAVILTMLTVLQVLGTSVGTYAYTSDFTGASAEGNVKGSYQYNGLTYNIIEREAVIMYSPVSGDVVIPDSINGYPVTEIASYAFYYCRDIKSITIGDSVERIGDFAFWQCIRMTKAVLGSSVKEIGKSSFQHCTLLNSISLPDGIINIGEYAFDGSGYYIKSSNWSDGVLYIGKHLIISKTALSGSYTIKPGTKCIADCAFRQRALTSVVIPSGVSSIGFCCFEGCQQLTKVVIPDSVNYILAYAFKNCTALKSIDLGENIYKLDFEVFFNTPVYNTALSNTTDKVVYIDNYLIYADRGISTGYSVKKGTIGIADRAFCDCIKLTSLTLPDTLKYIGTVAFSDCRLLKEIKIPKSVEYIGGNAFVYCKIPSVYINDIKSWCNIVFENADSNPMRRVQTVYIDGKKVTDITIPSGVESIGEYAFAGFATLKGIVIPDSVKSIGKECFYKCDKVVIKCNPGTCAAKYAQAYGIGTESLCQHSYGAFKSNNDATCSSDGTKSAVCTKGCGSKKTVTDTGSKLKHIFSIYVSNNDATCMADGTKTAKCDYGCGNTDTVSDPGSMCGDSFTKYKPNGDATCDTDGTKTAQCDFGCGKTDTLPDPGSAGHNWSLWAVSVEPTYESVGIKERVCLRCGEADRIKLPKLDSDYENKYDDISDTAWYADAVAFVSQKGYMKGMSATVFSPATNITREQFVLILANIAGVSTQEYKNIPSGFTDVKTGVWYSGAVTWAAKQGYVSGVSATKFGTGQSIQRAALARLLYAYAEKNKMSVEGRADLSVFADGAMFEKAGYAWMKEPVQWAVHAGIISGMEIGGKLSVNPKGSATRAQAARMLMVFDEKIG